MRIKRWESAQLRPGDICCGVPEIEARDKFTTVSVSSAACIVKISKYFSIDKENRVYPGFGEDI